MTVKRKVSNKKENVKKLYRSDTNKVLGGVCGGLGDFFSVDPVLIRLFFILFTLFGGGGILIYIVLWLIIPSTSSKSEVTQESIKESANEIQEKVQNIAQEVKNYSQKHSGKKIAGFILIVIGILILMSNLNFFRFGFIWKFWPIILIVLAIGLITKND